MSNFDDYLASASSTAAPQQASFDDYLKTAQPAEPAPAAVANPSGWQLPQGIQDIRQWVSDHGLGSSPQDYYAAIGHNVMKPLHGAAQLIEHGLGGAANLVAPGSSVAQFFNQDNAQNDAYLRKWESDYQNSVPDNLGTYAGAAVGQALPLLAGAGAKLGQGADYLAGLIPKAPQLVKSIISGATQGGLLGAVQPVTAPSGNTVGDLVQGTNGPSFLDQKLGQISAGAATGGTLSGLGGVFSGIGKGIQPLINPQATARNYVGNLLGDQAPQVLQNLRNAPTFVPGSVPTAAQAGGSPELVMAEKALSNQFPAFKAAQMARSNANNAARIDALQGVAGTPQDLASSLATRKAQTAPQIDNLLTNGKPVQVQPILDQLDALKNSSLGVRPTIKGAINDLRGEIMDRAQGGTMAPDVLDGLRQNIGDYLRKNAPNGAVGTQEGVAFGPVKDQISQAIDQANPGYLNYLADYARLSQPITDARAASGILDRLGNGSLNSAQQVQLTPRGFNAAMKQATKGPYPLSPNAQSTLEGIQNDLQRDTVSNAVKSAGSDTRYNMAADSWLGKQLYGPAYGGNGALPKIVGGVLGSFIPGVGTLGGYLGMGKLAEKGAERLGGAVTDLMMDPAKMASAIEQLQRTNPAAASQLQRLIHQQSSELVGQKVGQ